MKLLYSFYTADIDKAGTHSRIDVSHDGGDFRRVADMPGDDFVRGTIHGMLVEWDQQPDMNYLYVRSDGTGTNPGWKLMYVFVSSVVMDGDGGGTGDSWTYKFDTWFRQDKGLQHRSRLGLGLNDE
jgi:hypothetical protein